MSRRMTFEEFIEKYKNLYGETKYIFDESTFINSHSPMKVICPEHGEFWKSPKNILKYKCYKCSYEERGKKFLLTTDEFINRAKSKHGNKYDYSESIYYGTKKPIAIICDIHGKFFQTPNDHLNGKGCPLCNESHLERNVKLLLDEHNIPYIYQFREKWLGKQSIDFFIPSYNIAIECQGKQHFGFGGWIKDFNFEKLYALDYKKYNILKEHNIKPIYITNKEFLKFINNIEIYNEDNLITIENLIECIQKSK